MLGCVVSSAVMLLKVLLWAGQLGLCSLLPFNVFFILVIPFALLDLCNFLPVSAAFDPLAAQKLPF